MHLLTSLWPRFNAYSTDPKNPTFCAMDKYYGWTLEATPYSTQPTIILCPSSFTRDNLYNEEIPERLDVSPQPNGKVLDQMEPRSLTWYHELFHLVFDPGKYNPFSMQLEWYLSLHRCRRRAFPRLKIPAREAQQQRPTHIWVS